MSHVVLSLVLSLAAPAECARNDLACTARTAAREAREATDPRERAEARLTAARAHLAMSQGTGAKEHLCQARRFVAGLRPTPELGDLLPATREQIERELTRRKITCPKGQRPPPAVPSEPVPSTPTPDGAQQALEAPAEPSEPQRVDPPLRRPEDELLPVDVSTIVQQPPRAPTPAPEPVVPVGRTSGADVRPPAGRRLLIAGGVLVGGAAMAGGLAAVAAARAEYLANEQNTIAAKTHEQGFTDPASREASEELAAGVAHWERVMLGASVAGAVVGTTAVALLAAGAVKRRRAARVVVAPGFAGLLWTARF